jgi:molecular chaperone DnaK
VNVSAREQQTGKEQKITITGSSGLDKTEIDRMVEEAERNAAEDQKRREAVETKNQLDATVFQVKKFRDDNADKIGEAEKTQLESALNAAEEALKGDDQDAMKSANDQLTQGLPGSWHQRVPECSAGWWRSGRRRDERAFGQRLRGLRCSQRQREWSRCS